MQLLVTIETTHEVKGSYSPENVIRHLIALAKTQPPGAMISAELEQTPLYVDAASTYESVYKHWAAAKAQRMQRRA